MNFTAEEYTDMIVCYGLAGENAFAAARLYTERYPNRRHPTHVTITRCLQRSRETGVLLPQYNLNVPRRRHINVDEEVLRAFDENPGNSVRRVAHELDVPKSTVHRILRENGLHPFHHQRVQQLLERDEIQRVDFCTGIFDFSVLFFSLISYRY